MQSGSIGIGSSILSLKLGIHIIDPRIQDLQ
jgi:hypothetical protein